MTPSSHSAFRKWLAKELQEAKDDFKGEPDARVKAWCEGYVAALAHVQSYFTGE